MENKSINNDSYQSDNNNNNSNNNDNISTNNLLSVIKDLNNQITEIKIKSSEDIKTIKLEKENLEKKLDFMEISLIKAKTTVKSSSNCQDKSVKSLKNKLQKAQNIIESNESIENELKKSKKQIQDLKNLVNRLDASEKRYKNSIIEKDKEIEDLRQECHLKLNSEHNKSIHTHENLMRLKDEFDKKKFYLEKELFAKDQFINILTKKLEDTKKDIASNYLSSIFYYREYFLL